MCLDYIKISEYIDNVLDEQEMVLAKEHFDSCNKCRKLLNNFLVTVKTVNNLSQPIISDDFVNKIFLKIDEAQIHPTFEELSIYYDNELDEFSFYKIDKHVNSCESCQVVLSGLKNITDSALISDSLNVSANFMDNLFNKIDSLNSEQHKEENFIPSANFLDNIFEKIESRSSDENSLCISSEDISAFIDNELTNIEKSDIEEHLSQCAKCSSKLNNFKVSRESVLNLEKYPVPFDFSRKVIKSIDELETSKIKTPHKVGPLFLEIPKMIPRKAGPLFLEIPKIKFIPYLKKSAHKITMVAGIVIVGILVTMSNPFMETQQTKITVKSEDLLFSSGSSFGADSFEVLSDGAKDDSLQIQDIGL